MKAIYDPETDTVNFILRKGFVKESDELREGIIVDYDKEGRIISIEILDASMHTTKPMEIIYECKKTTAKE
ncbi:MAG: DUF2283 domain-containing protein [candidate division Zixibacteria bacterium]|jgi:uncharacterized protein YuzE|nr:DUF2283 domain-containing protein [candidate division Zixibacteria bacterium]